MTLNILSFVVFDQSNEMDPAGEVSSSFFSWEDDSKLKILMIKQNKNTIQHCVIQKMGVVQCSVMPSPTPLCTVCLSQ